MENSNKLQITSSAPQEIVLASGSVLKLQWPEVRTCSESLAAIGDNNPTLKSCAKQLPGGEKQVKALIKMSFIRLNRILNLKTPLTEEAIDCIADEIFRNYPFFRPSDIHLITWRIMTGKCGELYESLNIAKVLKWVDDYAEERSEECARLSLQRHYEYSYDPYPRSQDMNPINELFRRTKHD